MKPLTSNELTLLTTGALLVGGFLGWLGRGLGFLLGRRVTGAPKHERAKYLNTLADFGAKLRSSGMTFDDVHELERIIQNPSLISSAAVTGVVEQVIECDEPEAFYSNAAMKNRTWAAYEVAEANLNQALTDLRLLVGEEEWEPFVTLQDHWRAYRSGLEDVARREYEGGTHAGLAAMWAGLAETERRTAEVRAVVKERAAR
jgi:hypothetical protein